MRMTDRTFHSISAAVWYALLIAIFILAFRCKAQTVVDHPPVCYASPDKIEQMKSAIVEAHGGEIYFEVNDCKWHSGKNPRNSVKPALSPQHHLAPHTAPPVRPATACRVCTASGPVTGWEPCGKAHRTAQRLTTYWFYVWVESKIGK